MNRDEFIKKIDDNIKLIRTEMDFTQDKMAGIIGVSKKTLIQIEKGRSSLGWSGAVACACIFKRSNIMQMICGGDCEGIILSIAFESYEDDYTQTLGGKVWWSEVESKCGYVLQKNVISNHYRILDSKSRRICSSFDIEYMKKRLDELCAEVIS